MAQELYGQLARGDLEAGIGDGVPVFPRLGVGWDEVDVGGEPESEVRGLRRECETTIEYVDSLLNAYRIVKDGS